MSTVSKSFVMIDFAWYEDPGYSTSADKVDVQWSVNGTTWTTAATFNRYNAVAGWKLKTVNLPGGANNQATLYVAFLFTSAYGNNCSLDAVKVTSGPVSATTFCTIGTGTNYYYHPFPAGNKGAKTQMLFKASELLAAGIAAGNISSIGFDIASSSVYTIGGLSIKMGHTSLTTLNSGYVGGLSDWYSGPVTIVGAGWHIINFSSPFAWNGSSNVVVEVCATGSSADTYTETWYSNVSNTVAFHWSNYSQECMVASYSVSSSRPNSCFGVSQNNVGVLRGYVKNAANGAPIAGAIVRIGPLRDTSNSDGFYSVYNIPAASVTAACTAGSGADEEPEGRCCSAGCAGERA
jgi:hypothetical protein